MQAQPLPASANHVQGGAAVPGRQARRLNSGSEANSRIEVPAARAGAVFGIFIDGTFIVFWGLVRSTLIRLAKWTMKRQLRDRM
ncbi:hypothetical protein CXK92_21295 [Stutzerimonas stutzeri]|uniref:Uncharacterized protein n=1 Tax=Stutzerimonas stutzeri TaxID=316 RepID=A0A2N8RW94_STUST|nr:hypothetical protein CXK92_21295 [Stutzerimonas stutzeri]